MAANEDIRSGLGTIIYDYDRPLLSRPQILVTDKYSRFLISWMAVILSLTLPCLYLWLRRVVLAILPGSPTSDTSPIQLGFRPALTNYFAIPNDQDNPMRSMKKITKRAGSLITLDEASACASEQTPEKATDFWPAIYEAAKTGCRALNPASYNNIREYLAFWISILFFVLLWFGGIVATIVVADMAKGSIVSTASQNAGAWKSNPGSPDYLLGDTSIIDEDRQRRIWAYKYACYSGTQSDSSCEKFYKRRIPSTQKANVSCPFDGDMCFYGKFGAYRRTTELCDSNILGINVPASKRFHFRKTMDCAPLRVDSPYVKAGGEPVYPNEYLYDYGPLKTGDYYEYYTYRNPMEWKLQFDDNTPYTLSPYIYVPGVPVRSNFEPMHGATAGNKTVSLFFISTAGDYFHVLESHDPIFPAPKSIPLEIKPGKHGLFWYNNSTQAGVLGCVDSHEICPDSTGLGCWGPFDIPRAFEELKDNLERRRAFYLLMVALEDAYAWKVIQYLQANVLDATRKAQRIAGIRLHPEQWKVEVDGIFDAVLASMQIHIYDYARGTYHNHQNTIDMTPSSLQGDNSNVRAAVEISKMFKFKNNAYQNVSAVAFWTTMGGCVFVFLGSRRLLIPEKDRSEGDRGTLNRTDPDDHHKYQLWVTVFWERSIVVFSKKMGGYSYEAVIWTVAQTIMLFGLVRNRGENSPSSQSDVEDQLDGNAFKYNSSQSNGNAA